MALLHATVRVARVLAAEGWALRVLALHVHHGLSEHADEWLQHVRQLCQQWSTPALPVDCLFERVRVQRDPGQSLEAQARHARYAALRRMAAAQGCDLLLLGHHQQDQAETFLLQALRGAGLAGLAAMPEARWRDGICWARPWLSHPPEAIGGYVRQHGLNHIEDDSNADARFARNALRHQVLPALGALFPGAINSLTHAASHLGDVLVCHEQWLAASLPQVLMADGSGVSMAALQTLSPGVQRALLRAWFHQVSGASLPMRTTCQVQAALAMGKCTGRWPVRWHGHADEPVQVGQLCLYRGVLSWQAQLPAPSVLADACEQTFSLRIDGPGEHAVLAWHGMLRADWVSERGVSPALLQSLTVRPRQGGEQFQWAPNRPARSLKKQFQAAAVPAWARHAPLFWSGDRLVFVPGLGVDARAWAPAGEPQLALHWEQGVVPH